MGCTLGADGAGPAAGPGPFARRLNARSQREHHLHGSRTLPLAFAALCRELRVYQLLRCHR